jgi:hypothetical protein
MKLAIRYYLILITVLSVTTMSCLKDADYNNGEIQSTRQIGALIKPIEIKLTAASAANVLALSFANSPNDTTIALIPVNLATSDVAPTDIHVTLVQNNQIVTDYNAANTDTTVSATNPNPTGVITHDSVPTLFTVVNPGGVVTIPKGQHTGYLMISFKPADFLGITYAVGFTISKIAESGYVISGNLENGMVIINIKNQWDGNYHASGVRLHPVLGPFSFNYNIDMGTTNANTIEGNALADLGPNLYITINPDNSVTLASDAQTVFPQAGKENDYNPATKTFTLNYFYNTGAPRLISETLVLNQ